MNAKTYRRRMVEVEAARLPPAHNQKDIEAIVEWLQPGLIAIRATGDDEAWDFAESRPVYDWGTNYVELEQGGKSMMAKLGDWIVWDGTVALVLTNAQFIEMFEEA